MGFGTILSNLYECVYVSQKLKEHHITLYVNCEHTFYFNSELFKKIFNMEYLLTQFNDVIVADIPYNGELNYVYTLGTSKPGKINWDVFTSDNDNDIRKHYDHKLGRSNKFSFNISTIKIQGYFDIFSNYVYKHYNKKNEPYVSISFRGKNMTDVDYPIDNHFESFSNIVSNNLTYVCGTSSKLKERLSIYDNVFYNEMYINEEDFTDVYDEEKLRQLVLVCLDILYLKDSKHIYHFTYFNQISYFLFIPYIIGITITKTPIGYLKDK